jgi:hypothetical protein
MSDYDWFEYEKEERAFAEYVDKSRRGEKQARLEAEKRRTAMGMKWDPRRDGWHTSPSRALRNEWIRELGEFEAYEVADAKPGWKASLWRKMAGYRSPVPFAYQFSSLDELVEAIESGRVDDLLEVDMDRWDPPSEDLADRAWRGGLPGLGKRR